jgi:hypothetical protein
MLEREPDSPLRTAVLIATRRRAAPARCGVFADERRVVAATEAAEYRHESTAMGRLAG